MAVELGPMIAELDEKGTVEAVRRSLEAGADPLDLVEGLRDGMSVVGKRFEEKEYFLSELIMAAEIFTESLALIEPRLKGAGGTPKAAIVIGTVQGDIHDIGKNIVATLLRCDGFEVHDLGVDVPAGRFIEKLQETDAVLLGLSGLLTPGFDSMKQMIDELVGAGLRDRVTVLIGGGPVNERVVEYAGADAFGRDAPEAVRLANHYLVARG